MPDALMETITCPHCNGSGAVAVGPWGVRPPKVTCSYCGGSGDLTVESFESLSPEDQEWIISLIDHLPSRYGTESETA